jgi:purine-nucleoside phosphorylase
MNPSRTRGLQSSVKLIRDHLLPGTKLALVLGSGFHPVTAALQVRSELGYHLLRGFPKPSVPGHAGRLLCGTLGGAPVAVLSGRAHYYEGHSLWDVTFPIRALAAAGIQAILLTNAAGGIKRTLRPGTFMRLTDHINFLGENPLRGGAAEGASRFLDLSQTYDPGLADLLVQAARTAKVRLHSGVYLAVSGPSYETPAEIRAFRRWGADAVGMSTVPEAIVAHSLGMRVAGLSRITNAAAGLSVKPISHDEVIECGRAAGRQATELLSRFACLYAQA